MTCTWHIESHNTYLLRKDGAPFAWIGPARWFGWSIAWTTDRRLRRSWSPFLNDMFKWAEEEAAHG